MFNFRTKITGAQKFWREFSAWESAKNMAHEPIDRLDFEINTMLSKHFSGVYAVLKMDTKSNYELMFTVNGMPRHVKKIFGIIEAAPEIKLWQWQAFRPRDPGLKQVAYKGDILKLSDAYFEYAKDRAKLGIKVFVRGYGNGGIDDGICYCLIDRFIGELEVYEKIKWIDLQPLDENLVLQHFPLSHLPNIINGYDLEINN
ncbi:MAG: hypothetical protein ACI9RU_002187 [Litorivivens sp.]|jgi:hypothetical protein